MLQSSRSRRHLDLRSSLERASARTRLDSLIVWTRTDEPTFSSSPGGVLRTVTWRRKLIGRIGTEFAPIAF
jgi:hypothetical protein